MERIIAHCTDADCARRLHTAQDQGALVRDFVKWDDQPGSVSAAREALIEGAAIAATAPRGPVYVNIDAAIQEAPIAEPLPPVDLARRRPPRAAAPLPDLVAEAAAILDAGRTIVVLMGRMSRDADDWARRIALVERLGARASPTSRPAPASRPRIRRRSAAPATSWTQTPRRRSMTPASS